MAHLPWNQTLTPASCCWSGGSSPCFKTSLLHHYFITNLQDCCLQSKTYTNIHTKLSNAYIMSKTNKKTDLNWTQEEGDGLVDRAAALLALIKTSLDDCDLWEVRAPWYNHILEPWSRLHKSQTYSAGQKSAACRSHLSELFVLRGPQSVPRPSLLTPLQVQQEPEQLIQGRMDQCLQVV